MGDITKEQATVISTVFLIMVILVIYTLYNLLGGKGLIILIILMIVYSLKNTFDLIEQKNNIEEEAKTLK